jgi:hypothetical protein
MCRDANACRNRMLWEMQKAWREVELWKKGFSSAIELKMYWEKECEKLEAQSQKA